MFSTTLFIRLGPVIVHVEFGMSVTYKKMSVKIFDTLRIVHSDVLFNTKNDNGGVRPDPHNAHDKRDEEDGSGA
jgi:hypothetical protein